MLLAKIAVFIFGKNGYPLLQKRRHWHRTWAAKGVESEPILSSQSTYYVSATVFGSKDSSSPAAVLSKYPLYESANEHNGSGSSFPLAMLQSKYLFINPLTNIMNPVLDRIWFWFGYVVLKHLWAGVGILMELIWDPTLQKNQIRVFCLFINW